MRHIGVDGSRVVIFRRLPCGARTIPAFLTGGLASAERRLSPSASSCATGHAIPRAPAHRFAELGYALVALVGAVVALGACRELFPITVENALRAPYCETVHDGALAQPVNTLTNLGYALVALLMFRQIGRDRVKARAGSDELFYLTLFAWVVLGVGVTSAAFHASLGRWAGVLDNIAMNLFATFWIVNNVARGRGWTRALFVSIYGALNAVSIGILVRDDQGSKQLFAALLVLGAMSELMVRAPALWGAAFKVCAPRVYAGAAALAFAAGWSLWSLSLTDGPLCDPHGLLQGHGAWHLLTACALLMLFLHLRAGRCEPVRVAVPRALAAT